MSIFIDKVRKIKRLTGQSPDYNAPYAFVGMGNHAAANLYPVINFFNIELKYIVVQSPLGVARAKKRFPRSLCSNNISVILNDTAIKGCFVCTHPTYHFEIVQKLQAANKNVFVEKPPCSNSVELDKLIDIGTGCNVKVMVGLQKNYSPSVQILKKNIEKTHYYTLKYTTGSYPEGNAVTGLFIHPISLSLFLFGNAKIVSKQKINIGNGTTFLIHVQHKNGIIGSWELSTAQSWQQAKEIISVYTSKGCYSWYNGQTITFSPMPASLLSIPMDKVKPFPVRKEILYQIDTFNPTLNNNPIYYQGFFNEIKNFIRLCEGHKHQISTFIEDLRPVYRLLDSINQ